MKSIFIKLFLFLSLISCATISQEPDPIPPHEIFTFESHQVNETRTITIWTPPNYATSKQSFPVLYMPDGGLKEDFPHIANTLSELISTNQIPPHILVGIENTQRQRDLTGPTEVEHDKEIAPISEGSEQFRAFINDELIPEINKRYRTTDEKGIIGESLAGLFVIETFLVKPEIFNFYIAMDPSLWWNDTYLVKNAKNYLSNFPDNEIRLWFAGSNATDISKATNNLAQIFKDENKSQLKWKYSDEPNEKHNTIFRATKVKAIKWIMNPRELN